jgi:hypothetical protein
MKTGGIMLAGGSDLLSRKACFCVAFSNADSLWNEFRSLRLEARE